MSPKKKLFEQFARVAKPQASPNTLATKEVFWASHALRSQRPSFGQFRSQCEQCSDSNQGNRKVDRQGCRFGMIAGIVASR